MTQRSGVPAIADYGLLGDCQSAALVSREGSVDWWCPSRFDAPSAFARLLDARAGHWSIRPNVAFEVERAYVAETMVLETIFRTAGGVLRLRDALALGSGERGHQIGCRSPHALIRVLDGLEGEVPVCVEFTPRPEYGLIEPTLVADEGAIVTVGGAGRLLLTAGGELDLERSRARAEFVLGGGDRRGFSLQYAPAISGGRPAPLDPAAALSDTLAAWRSWSELHQSYDGPYAAEVRSSARLLQCLTYQPTGAIVAAPTTSLPEEIGGASNWDYRFAWLRDASMTLNALWVGACPDEAQRYFGFMARAAAVPADADHVQIMFGVQGERDLTEHELDHLRGYRDSAPVRVGNDAWRQKQLDVLGEVLESAYLLRDQLGEFDELTRTFLRELADRTAETWREPDAGIWEGREGERQYLTSKLMCWVALDRAVKLAVQLGAEDSVERWSRARDEVRQTILEQGWHSGAGAYTGAFGSEHLDAGVLLMPIVGFIAADDERMSSTISAIEQQLTSHGLVRRWTGAGGEGAFVICSYWLAHCHALAGDTARAQEVFDAVTAHANDLGLLSEEIDDGGQLISNFPQGLSHIGLINAAYAIQQALQQRTTKENHGQA
jgi:GH15 family glucan-1,4-alpha-glucosidase